MTTSSQADVSDVIKKRGMVEAKDGRFRARARILPNMDETIAQVAAVS